MAGEVSFKAYLTKESEDKQEVRRFSLDEGVATSYIYLKEKLRSLFTPLVLSQSFDIFWKDSDGDYVTICTDEELTIALTESRNEEVIKVYIKNNKTTPTPVNTTRGPSHDGVFCDGCESPISGFRYKCLGCRDYDLCASCEARGVHGEHFTLRIPTPLNVRHPFGHRLINKISKAAKRAESRCPWNHRFENLAADFNTNCTTEEPHGPRHFRPYSSEAAGRRGSSQGCADPKECGKACNASQDNNSKATASASISLDPAQIPNMVFNTLADFGIDLASFLTPPSTSQPSTASNNQAKEESKKKTPETGESSAPKMAKMSAATEPTAPPATPAENYKGNKRNSLLDEWTVYNGPNETQETSPEASAPIEIDLEMEINSSTSSNAGDKTSPMEVTKQTEAAKPSDAPSTSQLYPSLATLPKNKKVADALDQMLAMGFRNDDEWLTELLNAQDGNIARVLDLIQSKAQGKK